MSNIINEINEEINQERIANFLSKYFLNIVLLFITVIIAVFIYTWNQNKLYKNYENIELEYSKTFSEKNSSNLNIFDEIIKKDQKGYKQLALLEKGHLLIKLNRTQDAVDNYDKIFSVSSNEDSIKYLANFLSIVSLIDLNKKDLARNRLDNLLDKGNPFYISNLFAEAELLISEEKYLEASTLIESISLEHFVHPNIKKNLKKLTKIFRNNK